LVSFSLRFAQAHRLFVQLDALVAVAFHQLFDPQHDFGVDRLRTGVATPQTAGNGGPDKQAECTAHQQCGQIDKVLRPDGQAENVELAVDHVKEHRLPAIPGQPGQAKENQLSAQDKQNTPVIEDALDAARVDLFVPRTRTRFRTGFGGGGVCSTLTGISFNESDMVFS
jgi:hypothetical protein